MALKTADYTPVSGFVYGFSVSGSGNATTSFQIEVTIQSKTDGKVKLLAGNEESTANLTTWSQAFLSAYLEQRIKPVGKEPGLTVYYEQVANDKGIRRVLFPGLPI